MLLQDNILVELIALPDMHVPTKLLNSRVETVEERARRLTLLAHIILVARRIIANIIVVEESVMN